MAYIYDPSQQISQSLGKAAAGAGNIFTQVIQEKQQNFKIAQELESNIQSLKKELNQFSRKTITDKSNALLSDMKSTIFKEGKLDYTKLREVRDRISDLNDLKNGWEIANEQFEQRLKLGLNSKDEIVSITNYYSDLTETLSNEDLIKNPQDLNTALDKVYNRNLDRGIVTKKLLSSYLGKQDMVKGDALDSAGNKYDYAIKDTYAGFTFDPNTRKMIPSAEIPDSKWDAIYNDIKQNNPSFLKMLQDQDTTGATEFFNESNGGDLIKTLALQSAGQPSFETTTAAQLQAEADKRDLEIQVKQSQRDKNLAQKAAAEKESKQTEAERTREVDRQFLEKTVETMRKSPEGAKQYFQAIKDYYTNKEQKIEGNTVTYEDIKLVRKPNSNQIKVYTRLVKRMPNGSVEPITNRALKAEVDLTVEGLAPILTKFSFGEAYEQGSRALIDYKN